MLLKATKILKTFVLTISYWLILKIPPWIVTRLIQYSFSAAWVGVYVSRCYYLQAAAVSLRVSVYVLFLVPTNVSCILGLCPWWPELNSGCLPLALQVGSLPEPGAPLSARVTDLLVSECQGPLVSASTPVLGWPMCTSCLTLQGARDMDSAPPIFAASPFPTEPSPQLLWFFFFLQNSFRQTNAHLLPCVPCFNLVRSFSIWFFHSEN